MPHIYCICCGLPISIIMKKHEIVFGCMHLGSLLFIIRALFKHCHWVKYCRKNAPPENEICPLKTLQKQRADMLKSFRSQVEKTYQIYGKCNIYITGNVITKDEIDQLAKDLNVPLIYAFINAFQHPKWLKRSETLTIYLSSMFISTILMIIIFGFIISN